MKLLLLPLALLSVEAQHCEVQHGELCLIQRKQTSVIKSQSAYIPEDEEHLFAEPDEIILPQLEKAPPRIADAHETHHQEKDLIRNDLLLAEMASKQLAEARAVDKAMQEDLALLQQVEKNLETVVSKQAENKTSSQEEIALLQEAESNHDTSAANHMFGEEEEESETKPKHLGELMNKAHLHLLQNVKSGVTTTAISATDFIDAVLDLPSAVKWVVIICITMLSMVIVVLVICGLRTLCCRPTVNIVTIHDIALGDMGDLFQINRHSKPVKNAEGCGDDLEKSLVHGQPDDIIDMYLVVSDCVGDEKVIATHARGNGVMAMFARSVEIAVTNSFFAKPITFDIRMRAPQEKNQHRIFRYKMNNTAVALMGNDSGIKKFQLTPLHTYKSPIQDMPQAWIAMRFDLSDCSALTLEGQGKSRKKAALESFIGQMRALRAKMSSEVDPDTLLSDYEHSTTRDERTGAVEAASPEYRPAQPRKKTIIEKAANYVRGKHRQNTSNKPASWPAYSDNSSTPHHSTPHSQPADDPNQEKDIGKKNFNIISARVFSKTRIQMHQDTSRAIPMNEARANPKRNAQVKPPTPGSLTTPRGTNRKHAVYFDALNPSRNRSLVSNTDAWIKTPPITPRTALHNLKVATVLRGDAETDAAVAALEADQDRSRQSTPQSNPSIHPPSSNASKLTDNYDH